VVRSLDPKVHFGITCILDFPYFSFLSAKKSGVGLCCIGGVAGWLADGVFGDALWHCIIESMNCTKCARFQERVLGHVPCFQFNVP
jgi:hypothetical protein